MNVPQICLTCETTLRYGTRRMECPACGAHWPVDQSIPSYDSATYYGDVTPETMHELIALAERGHWLAAAHTMFRDSNPELYDYVADLNRACWIPILPLGPNSTVLDLSSGLGALTHALALNYHHVVSVEPVEDMARFTKLRLDQEGLKNVDVIHTTVAVLPFSPDTFDLIVLNGLLEWVREWRSSETPREAQIAVLTDLRRLLKPRGVLVIGSENRIGYTSFLRPTGRPRVQSIKRICSWFDALYRRLEKPGFYRALADPTKAGRPDSHTPNGYLDLLRQARFPFAEVWWPPSGYNSPHTMLRASNREAIRSYWEFDRRYKDRLHGYALARHLRHWAFVDTHLIHKMLPDVIMIARPTSDTDEQLHYRVPLLAAFEEDLAGDRYFVNSVTAHPYKNKVILTVVSTNREAHAVVKVANVRLPGAEIVQRSYHKLHRLYSSFKTRDPLLADSIPSPMGIVRVGSLLATMESSARGSRLVDLVLDRQYFDRRDCVRRHLERISSWLIASKPALDALGSDGILDAIPSEWLVAPAGDTGATQGSSPECFSGTQHGDFHPENVFIDEESQQMSVIDWDSCRTGYPPLFDWFCLVTGLYYTHVRVRGLPKGHTVEFMSFRQTYFEASWFSELILSLSHRLCDRLGVDSARLLDYFRLYIVVRYRQFVSHSQVAERHYWGPLNTYLYKQYYELLLQKQKQCCFWKPLAPRSF